MRPTKLTTIAGLAAALALAGCANGPDSGLTTSSVTPQQRVAAKPAIDPACITLASQINAARQEGTPSRVGTIATGKTKTVVIKRAALAKVAELDRLNAQYQMRCSKYPGIQATAAPAQSATTLAPAARKVGVKPGVARTNAAQLGQQASAAPSTPIVAVPPKQ